jgi:hypothetical protein
MARPTKQQREQTILDEALAEFNRIWSAQQEVRLQSATARRFAHVPGAQWEGPYGEQFENKPKPEVNKVQIALQRLFGEYRNNRIVADFIPKDGSEDDELADVCDGLYRADCQDSCAEEGHDNAFEEGVSGGMGAWRLVAEYEKEDDDDDTRQRIRFEPIYDADSCVFFDIDARRYDKSDAKCAYVLYPQTVEAYKAEWGDDPATWPKDDQTTQFDWNRPNFVYLAEYYRLEKRRETVHVFVDAEGEEHKFTEDELEDYLETEGYTEVEGTDTQELDAMLGAMTLRGFVKVREDKRRVRKVRKYIMSGGKILEDCGYIAGKHIPIIPFYARRAVIDGIERFTGHVALAQDTQRIKNAQYAKLMEISALSAVEKPIFTPEQMASHQNMWSQDNITNYPYLLVNPITDAAGNPQAAGPIGYTKPPQIPQALAALMQFSEQDMMDILGRPQDGEEIVSNMSGKAVEMIQQRLDTQSFIYFSNFAKSIRREAEVWLSMAKELYNEQGRKMKRVGPQGNLDNVVLRQEMLDPESGELTARNDLSRADFDVVESVGPSFESKRNATVRTLTGMLPLVTDPADAKVLQAVILQNMEGEGLADVNEYYRKELVKLGVNKPTEEEQAQMEAAAQAAQQPDPQAEFLASEAAKNASVARLNEAKALQIAGQVDKAVAETENVDADTALKQADTVKREAETLEILRGEPPAP